jgi:hypothetical protein
MPYLIHSSPRLRRFDQTAEWPRTDNPTVIIQDFFVRSAHEGDGPEEFVRLQRRLLKWARCNVSSLPLRSLLDTRSLSRTLLSREHLSAARLPIRFSFCDQHPSIALHLSFTPAPHITVLGVVTHDRVTSLAHT